jgi:flagellin-specific chaperone FliS
MTQMQACCAGNAIAKSPGAVLKSLTRALSVDPGNPYTLANLEALYEYAVRQSATGGLKIDEQEIISRLSQVRELRAALNDSP